RHTRFSRDWSSDVCSSDLISCTFGGINLEDIKAPECFEIERALIEQCDIPVFHDDQHGTAIVTAAAMINALELADKKIEDAKIEIGRASCRERGKSEVRGG